MGIKLMRAKQSQLKLKTSNYEENVMKRILPLLGVLIMLVGVTLVYAGEKSTMDLKVGDEIYACNCGDDCPCKTMSRNAGKCTCGKEMVKAKVTKIDGDVAMLSAADWPKERSFPTTGKFMCACGTECNCDTISQSPGKCSCGKEMKEVK